MLGYQAKRLYIPLPPVRDLQSFQQGEMYKLTRVQKNELEKPSHIVRVGK